MAFINKIGNILRQTSSKLSRFEASISNASLYQAVRCFSSSKLFIGGLSFAIDENSLREAFTPYGDVIEARIIVDRESGRSRGFGFVSYTSAEEASAAIQALDGRDLHGRFIRVAYAADQRRTSRGPNFFGGAGYADSFRETGGHGPVGSHTGGNYSSGYGNYGASGSYGFYGSTGRGSTGGDSGSNYDNPKMGNCEDIPGIANASSNENTPRGGSFADGSYGGIGSFNGSHQSDGNSGNYDTSCGGASNFNSRTPYNSIGREHGDGDGDGNNLYDQDETKGNINDNGFWKDDENRGYANARGG